MDLSGLAGVDVRNLMGETGIIPIADDARLVRAFSFIGHGEA